jgi:hypothetical protein
VTDSDYITDLSLALAEAGIDRHRRVRIIAEFEDHLSCDPQAQLGSPRLLARQFADELGTDLARRAALRAFGALAVAGVLFAIVALGTARVHSPARAAMFAAVAISGPPRVLVLALIVCAIAAQTAFVAGSLGAMRAIRLRRQAVIATEEAAVLARRAGVGLAAGAVTMLALPAVALTIPHALGPGWSVMAFAGSAIGIAAIAAAAPGVVAAGRLRPQRSGPAGDLVDDLSPVVPARVAGSPWRVAAITSTLVTVLIAGAGVIQLDPYDGLIRGILDGGACLAGFGLLGRYLGLRSDLRSDLHGGLRGGLRSQ